MQGVWVQSLIGKLKSYVLWPKSQNIKLKQYRNKFNKDLKNGPHKKKKNPQKNVTSTGGYHTSQDKL